MKNTLLYLSLFISAIFISLNSSAQLVGGTIYPINGIQNPPSSFSTVANAFTYINTSGTSGTGNIILEIQSGYTGEAGVIPALTAYAGMDPSRPITLRPGAGQNPIITTSPAASASVIEFSGSKYFTIDGSNNGTNSRNLTIQVPSTNTTTTVRVIGLIPTASSSIESIAIRNCNIIGGSTTTAVNSAHGIYMGGATNVTAAARGGNNNNLFYNNYIQAVRTGIYLRGTNSSATMDSNNVCRANLIGGTINTGGTGNTTYVGGVSTIDVANGILYNSQNFGLIDSNIIRNNVQANYYFTGINLAVFAAAGVNTNCTVSNNRISDIVYNGSAGYGVNAIRVETGTSTANNLNVINNFIWNIATDGDNVVTIYNYALFAISLPTRATVNNTNVGVNILHNTINMYPNGTQTLLTRTNLAAACVGMAPFVAGGVRILNNNFRNVYPGNGSNIANSRVMAVYVGNTSINPMAAINNGRINYNNYFVNGPTSSVTNAIGFINNALVSTLSAWRTATTGDTNSVSVDPGFISNTDLRCFRDTIDNGGIPVGVATDIFNTARNVSTPDIGAFEFTLSNMVYDSSSVTQASTASVVQSSTNQVILRVKVASTGILSPLNLTRIRFSTSGSTNAANDIDSAKVFFTGNSTTYSTSNLLGSVASPNGTFVITGSRTLTPGDNYFWLAYNIKSSATVNNLVDALVDSIYVGGVAYVPANRNPAGSRTILGQMNGNYNIGAGQVYTTITSALTDLYSRGVNAPVTFTLTDTLYSTNEVFPITLSAYNNASSINTVTFRPGSNSAHIFNSTATATIRFDGGQFYRFDGRRNGITNPKSLLINNSNIGGNAVVYINDASNNNIRFTNIIGANNVAAGGVVFFSTGLVNGNDNNLIDSCDIGDGASVPATIINASGSTTSATILNSNNTISNCNIYNFWNATGENNAFKISAGNTDWTITGNNIYQTSPRVGSATLQQYVWNLNKGSDVNALNNMTITNNIIGGSAPGASGTPWTVSGAAGLRFTGTYLNLGTTTNSIFQNNRFSNFNWTTTDASATIPGTWNGVWMVGGIANIQNNTIGSMNSYGNIVVSAGNGSVSFPIGSSTGATGNMVISGNQIGGIQTLSTSNANGVGLIAIAMTGTTTTYTISNNVIGGTVQNSLHTSTPSTATAQTICGIQNGASGAVTITGNIIRNMRNSYAGTTAGGVTGIQNNSGGVMTVTNNIIANLAGTATNPSTVVFGIRFTTTTAGQTISNNQVFNLAMDTIAPTQANVSGIWYSGAATGTNVISSNFIHSLSNTSTNRNASLTGINIQAGNTTIFNNMVRLGIDSTGTTIVPGYGMSGISEIAGTNNYYHNSVYVGGSSVNDSSNTFAFSSTSTTTVARDILNNAFTNFRLNNGSVAKNYAIRLNNITNLNANNNIYFASANGLIFGVLGTTDYATFNSWKAIGRDGSSAHASPNFVNAVGNASSVDLHVTSPTPIESNGINIPSITTDYDGQTRSGLTPTDIGADAGNFTSIDLIAPTITYSALSNTGLTTTRTLTVTISDPSAVYLTGTNVPRIYFRKMSFGGYVSATGTLTSGTRFNGTWSFPINPSLVGGVTIGDSIYYYVIAQDSSSSNNIGSVPSGVDAINTASIVTHPTANNSYAILASYSGNINVGTGNTFTTLTGAGGAFQALSNAVLSGNVTLTITSNITEPGTFSLDNVASDGGPFRISIVPDGTTERIISGAVASPGMIRMNGTLRLTIDGRFGGVGRFLKFANNSTTGPVFNFLNDARRDTLINITILGNNTSTGNVLFSTTTGTTGNDSIGIIGCYFRDTISLPTTHINSTGTTSAPNTSNYIAFNEFVNFTANAINITATGNGNNWFIYRNFIYQQATRTTAISCIAALGGTQHIIRGNSIGGAATDRSGTPFTNTTSYIRGIEVSATTPAVLVDSNLFSNVVTTGTAGVFGVYINSGDVNVFSNTFGGNANPQDTIQNGYDNGIIFLNGGTNINIDNNLIGNIRYIKSGGDRTSGIYLSSSVTNLTITNNVIRDINHSGVGSGVTNFRPSGIILAAGITTGLISRNTIFNINSTTTGTVAYTVSGIYVSSTVVTNTIFSRNRIYNIGTAGTGTAAAAPTAYGIQITSQGTGNQYIHNQISIGNNTSGETFVAAISDASTSASLWYYNSIFVNGNIASGTNNSYCIQRTSTADMNLRNNIFYNKRTTQGTGFSYATGSSSATGITAATSNYNLFVVRDTARVSEFPSGVAYGTNAYNNFLYTPSNYNTNWIELSGNLAPQLFFTDTAIGNLGIINTNSNCWYVSGKGMPLAGVSGDYNAASGARSISIATGSTDIGSVEFTTSTLPPSAIALSTPANSSTTNYVFAGRTIANINWGATGTVPGSVDVKYYSGVNAPNPIPARNLFNAYLSLIPSGGTNYSYTLQMISDTANMGTVPNSASIRMARFASPNWNLISASNYITSQGLLQYTAFASNTFGNFTGTDINNALPVSLLDFHAKSSHSNDVNLSWTTAYEKNNSGFEVQRSANGVDFEYVSFVKGQGNSSTLNAYQYNDLDALQNHQTVYYRLKQIDFSGEVAFSEIRSVSKSMVPAQVYVYPNPTNNTLDFHASENIFGNITYEVVDLNGRTLISKSTNVNKNSIVDIEGVSLLPAGIYFLKVISPSATHINKFIKN